MSPGLPRRKGWGGLWWSVLWGLRRGVRLSELVEDVRKGMVQGEGFCGAGGLMGSSCGCAG